MSVTVVPPITRDDDMIAPLATLAFLLVLWLAAVLFAEFVGRSGQRVLGALKGEAPTSCSSAIIRKRAPRVAIAYRPLRARPQLRAAA